MNLPENLVSKIQSGDVVLFLGAGASAQALTAEGGRIPGTAALAALLAGEFLGGKHRDKAIGVVADLCLGGATEVELENYIKKVFVDAIPTAAHKKIPLFTWAGIATTNYDDLIEKAYASTNHVQSLVVSTSDEDRATYQSLNRISVELLKLHGCIRRAPNTACPLILTVDQYADHIVGRQTLFNRLQDWASRYPILFVGSSLQDPDIIARLRALPIKQRLQCYLVAPDIDELATSAWNQKRVSAIKGTFSQLMDTIAAVIPSGMRRIGQMQLSATHNIQKKFVNDGQGATMFLMTDLATSLLYIEPSISLPPGDPLEFYRGSYEPFAPALSGLDFKRDMQDAVLESVLLSESEVAVPASFTLITGPAGSGKSVLLQRIGLELSREYNCLVLYLRVSADLPLRSVYDVLLNTNEPVYLLVDDASDHVDKLSTAMRWARQNNQPLHVIATERSNEWNMATLERAVAISHRFDIRPLSNREAKELLAKLDGYGLAKHLAHLEHSDQVRAITKPTGAGGDLLVATYQATYGAPLQEIIKNEFENIRLPKARDIYLTVCALNRMNILVRAGSIYRIHGVNFEDFKQEFLMPLEKIVYDVEDANRDLWYRARHAVVAEIVFNTILSDEEERLNCLLRCLGGLDAGYESDRLALAKLTHNDQVKEIFRSTSVGRTFYDAVIARFETDPYVAQQAAVYELANSNGDFSRAAELVKVARERGPGIPAIRHTEAVLHLRLGSRARTPLEREKEFKAAEVICRELVKRGGSPFPHHTLASIAIERLKAVLRTDDPGDSGAVDNLIFTAESNIEEGSRLFPEDAKLAEVEADLAGVLADDSRVRSALVRALELNPGRYTAALALSRLAVRSGDNEAAIGYLEAVLVTKPNSIPVKFSLAERLIARDLPQDAPRILQLAESCYGRNAPHPKAQLIHGRQLLLSGDITGSRAVFSDLRNQPVPGGRKWRLYPLAGRHSGLCQSIDPYVGGRISTDSLGSVYLYLRDVSPQMQNRVHQGTKCEFNVSFNASGPIATHFSM